MKFFATHLKCLRIVLFSLLLMNLHTLPAQTLSAGMNRAINNDRSDVSLLVSQLSQTALLILLVGIGVLALLFIGHIAKSSADLSKRRNHSGGTYIVILTLGLGLATGSSSCSSAQKVQAADIQKAQRMECPMNHHDVAQTHINNSPYNGYSNWNNPLFCKRCGKRIFGNR